jgi:hypothetical protein
VKLKNTTDGPDHFLRRATSWVAKQIGLPIRRVREVVVRNRADSASGRAYWSMRVVVSIGRTGFPQPAYRYPGRTNDAFMIPAKADRLEALIGTLAHELTHLRQFDVIRWKGAVRKLKRTPGTERPTTFEERRVLELFKSQREELLTEWNIAPPEKVKPSLQEQRRAKALRDLERWQRKLKLAQTKVKQKRRRLAYYDRAIAAKRSGQ